MMATEHQSSKPNTIALTSIDIKKAREIALISLLVPILFMASLVSAAILLMNDANHSLLIGFWLVGHVFLCAVLFLQSTRQRA
jgi:hypothetical protein